MAKQTIIKTIFQIRRDSNENWLLNGGVIPAEGEPCFDLDLNTLKIGDGKTTYANLPVIGGGNVEVVGDNISIVLEDGVFKLAGFDAAETGAQPRKTAEGGIEWVVPSTETVEGLQSAVADLQSDLEAVQNNVTTVQNSFTTLEEQVTTIESNVTTIENNVTELKEIVTPSGEGAVSLLGRVEGLEAKVGPEAVEKQIKDKIDEFATTVNGGAIDTFAELVDYVGKHGSEVTGILSSISTLQNLVGKKAVSEQILEAVETSGHMSTIEAMARFEKVKYEVINAPVGTVVDYREKEIRIMCPSDTEWKFQSVGATGDASKFYIAFKAYAPNDSVVGFKEDMSRTISDNTMYAFEGNDFAGIDEFGRKYSLVWLAVAHYDATTQTWNYYGDSSSTRHYVGFDYSVEWYDNRGIRVGADTIRINLSNPDCHSAVEAYYMSDLIKGVSVGGTLLEPTDGKVEIPMGAGLKASEEVTIAADGTLGIGKISFSKIEQEEGEEIHLDGGSATSRQV